MMHCLVDPGKRRARVVVHAGGLPLTATGRLRLGIALRNEPNLLGFWDIDINVIGPPVVVQPGGTPVTPS